MNLSITLYDQSTTPLPRAKLRIRYQQPNGKWWKSPPLKTNAFGTIGYSFDAKLFALVDFRKAEYYIEYQGETYRARPITLPNQQDPRLHLQAEKLNISPIKQPTVPPVQDPVRSDKSPLLLKITVTNAKGDPLKRTPLGLKWGEGKAEQLQLGKTTTGGALQYSTTEGEFRAVMKAEPQLFNVSTGQAYEVIDRSAKIAEKGVLEMDWQVKLAAAPPKPPVPEEDIKDPPPPKPQEDTPDAPAGKMQIIGTLLQENDPVTGRSFALTWVRKSGMVQNIPLPKTDEKGTFLWEGEVALAMEAALSGAKLYDQSNARLYKVDKQEGPHQDGTTFRFTWHILETEEDVVRPPEVGKGDQGLVAGVISATNGQPQVGVVVRAFDIDFPEEIELGAVETDDDGFYAINYAAGTALEREKNALDIVVRVYKPGTLNKPSDPLAESRLEEKAPIRLTVDLVAGGEHYAGASLYERIYKALLEVLEGTPLTKLTPASLALLAARTRYSKVELGRYVGAWALAVLAKLARKDPLSAAPFFGWLMDGLPAHPLALALQPADKLEASLKRAVEANWIPKGDYKGALEAAHAARTAIIAEHQPELIAYLKAGGLNDAQAKTVIEIFLQGLDAEARAEQFTAQLGKTKGERVIELIEIWQALGGNSVLGTAILQDSKIRVPRNLVELDQATLVTLIKASKSVPDHVEGANLNIRSGTYAETLLNRIENRYPLAYFAHQLTLSTYGETQERGNRLKKSLEMQPLRVGGADPVIIDGWDQVLVDLASLYASAVPQRRAPLVDQLIRHAYDSAPDIVAHGLSHFREKMRGNFAKVGEAGDVDYVYTRAQFLVSLANAVKMQEIAEQMPEGDLPATLSGQLFEGSINGACPHCKSMTSPSAYLLDLVRYSQRASGGGQKTGWDRIDQRRHDLKNIHLTCANSDTEMPYIDLVLELLEDEVARWTDPPRQTTLSAEELGQRPAFVNMRAYSALTSTDFPWAARFHRGFALARGALAQAGVSLAELREASASGGAAAALGLWDGALFALQTAAGKIAEAFGVANLTTLRKIETIEALAAHLLIDAELLLDMLSSGFVNPGALVMVAQSGDLNWSNLDNPTLARLALLGQMQARSDMSLSTLEHWLRVVDPAKPTWQADMAAALRMAEQTGLTADDIAALMAMSDAERLAELSVLADVPEAVIAQIAAGVSAPVGRPVGMEAVLSQTIRLSDEGARDTGVMLALISVPEAGGLFDPDAAAKALSSAQEAYDAGFGDATGEVGAEELMLVGETLAAALSTDAAMLQLLIPGAGLVEALRDGTATAEQVMRLWKHAEAATLLELESDDVLALPDLVQKFGLIDIANLPVDAGSAPALADFATLVALADMNAQIYRYEGSLFLRLAGATNQLPRLRTALELPDLPAASITALLGAKGLGLSATSDLMQAGQIARLTTLIAACRHLRTDGTTLLSMADSFDANTAWTFAESLSPSSAWAKTARQISDPVREACRDALLSKVMFASRSGAGKRFDTVADVYAHFLIDPGMMAVVDTSRIKQASASIQQFVQRVQLGLEPGVVFSQNDAMQWVWRRNYRVWEANRKVMVFPENWIRPELRDNKTDLYRQLESDLMKDEIRAETAEAALLDYARGLHDVAGLEMAGMYEDIETGTTYVVGRTRETPHTYYFNARGPNMLWSGWEQIEIEIDGDHVIPVVYARRVFLAWVTFDTKIAVDDPAYIEKISQLEAEQNFVRDEIDAIKRKISDIESKREDNAEYLNKDWSNDPVGTMLEQVYQNLEDAYLILLDKLQGSDGTGGDLQEQRDREAELILEINSVKDRYTYCEARLSLTQKRRAGGWEPVKKSSSFIRTILENDSWLFGWANDGDKTLFYDQIDQFFIKVSSTGQDLTFTLCYSTNKDADEHNEHTLGWFYLDVVNNVLTATEKYSVNWDWESTILLNGQIARQKITLTPEANALTVLDNGEVPLLRDVSTKAARAVPNEYAAGTSLIFEQDQRSYLVEKAAIAPRPHVQADTIASRRLPSVPVNRGNDVVDLAPPDVQGVGLAGDDGWQFTPLYHPFSDVVVTELYRYGLEGLYLPDAASGQQNAGLLTRQRAHRDNFVALFDPSAQVAQPYPAEMFNFSRTTPFGVYNWELFFHAPYAIAEHLRQNRKFEEARRWFHFIFNPLDKDAGSLAKVWRFGPFHKEHQRILDGDTPDLMDDADNPDFAGQVEEWERNPFNPHAIARTRTVAYMRAVYMAYLENLMDWGDDLFRRDTMESVNEAAQLYVFAGEMLGPRPVILPDIDDGTPPKSLGEALSWAPSLARIMASAGKVAPHPDNQTAGSAFFELFGDFCMPSNDKLLGIWTRLEDRMFKIRHSLNIEGAFRKLALYQPPIDPALLVKAAASGLSLGDAIAGASSKRPNYRFTFMVAKSLEFAADVRALGSGLLAALEKRDAESLSLLRASHEKAMNRQMRMVYEDRIKEAGFNLAGLDAEIDRMVSEELHYDALITIGDLPQETEEADQLKKAHNDSQVAGGFIAIGSLLSAFPQLGAVGLAPEVNWGGIHLANVFRALGESMQLLAAQHSYNASKSARSASRIRRTQDWLRAKESAKQTIKKLQQDRLASEIRLALAEKELDQHDLRIAQSEESETFLKDKFTSEALYDWMVDQLSGLHFQAYKLASDLARQAETCYRDELNDDSASFVDPGAWDSLRKGLLAGEQLTLCLRRMEAAYLAANTRSHELSKSISLAQLNPMALMSLRTAATADFSLPEYIFDLDHPGHVNRRIKSVNITIPALAGPQTSIACTLTLTSSSRRVQMPDGSYELQDGRSGESVATSTGQNDTGMFQFDFKDPRYLKFEGAGAVSSWTITLPDKDVAQFDYASITDVIMQVHYTADDGPPTRAGDVTNTLRGAISTEEYAPQTMFSLRFDFPETWARLKNEDGLRDITLDMTGAKFPYLYAARSISLGDMTLYSVAPEEDDVVSHTVNLGDIAASEVALTLPGPMRDALNGSARDILIVAAFSAGPA